MDKEIIPAAPQPAPQAQPSGGEKKSGAANSTVNAFAASLVRKEKQQQVQADAVEKAPEKAAEPAPESTQPATEETQVSPAEANPEETAAPEQAAPEPEEKADEVLSHETKLDPKTQAKIDKRIDKLAVENKSLKARIAQLQEQSAAAPQTEKVTTVPVPMDMPLADVSDFAKLQQIQRAALENQAAAEELLDRDDIANGVKVGDRVYSKADLKAIARDARKTLTIDVPAREKFLTDQHTSRQQALTTFPYLKDRTSDEYMEHQAALRANPWLMAQPNADWIVGVQLRGLKAMTAEAEAAKVKATEKKLPPKPKPAGDQTMVAADASAARVPVGSSVNQAKAAASKFLEGKRGVGPKDFAALLRHNESVRNSR